MYTQEEEEWLRSESPLEDLLADEDEDGDEAENDDVWLQVADREGNGGVERRGSE
jgi:hypothetical protein